MQLFNFKGKQNSITDALQVSLPEHAVISFVGAGGKTSLIFAWAEELAAQGKKVIVTTTTHMYHPEFAKDIYRGSSIVYYSDYTADSSDLSEDCSRIDALLAKEGIVMIASEDSDKKRKVKTPPIKLLEYAYETADVILIEADGSGQMPLKWPKPNEPVVPERTDFSLCVAGLSSMGRTLDEAIYGASHMPKAMSRPLVDEELIAAIVSSPDGGLKGTFGDYRVFLNQADTEELQEKSEHLQKMFAVRIIQSARDIFLIPERLYFVCIHILLQNDVEDDCTDGCRHDARAAEDVSYERRHHGQYIGCRSESVTES